MKDSVLKYAFFQGKIVPMEEASVPINLNALQYGNAVFGGIRGYYSDKGSYVSVFRLEDHNKRFLSSIRIFGCEFGYSAEDLNRIVVDLLEKNNPKTDVYFRPFAYVGDTELGPNLANKKLDFAVYMLPLGEYLPVDVGLSVGVSSWRRISDNAIPPRGKISGAYINSSLARKEAADNGYDEAIMLNDRGLVCEGSAENIFIVRDGVLVTPGVSDDILEGITRRSVMQVASDLGIPVEVRSVARSELYVCDEAFFSGTGVQVAWIGKVDRRVVGDGKKGKITGMLQDKFFEIVRGKDAKYEDWCTKVKVK